MPNSKCRTRKRIYKETQYFSVITTRKGYRVIRVAQVRCEAGKGEPDALHATRFAALDFPTVRLRTWRCSVAHIRYCDVWALCSAMEIRPHNSLYDDVVAKLCISQDGFYANSDATASGAISRHFPVRLSKPCLDPRIETLMKGGKIEVMEHFLFNARTADECWASYLIAKRHQVSDEQFLHVVRLSAYAQQTRSRPPQPEEHLPRRFRGGTTTQPERLKPYTRRNRARTTPPLGD